MVGFSEVRGKTDQARYSVQLKGEFPCVPVSYCGGGGLHYEHQCTTTDEETVLLHQLSLPPQGHLLFFQRLPH